MSTAKREFAPTKWEKDAGVAANGLRIRAVDHAGAPVDGAFAGNMVSGNYAPDDRLEGQPPDLYLQGVRIELPTGRFATLRFVRAFLLPQSGADGIIDIPAEPLPITDPIWQPNRPDVIYIMHPGRGLGGLACCRAKDLGSYSEVVLEPLCHVHGTVVHADGENLPGFQTRAFWGPIDPWFLNPVEHFSFDCSIDMFLPPGCYLLNPALIIVDKQGAERMLEAWRRITIRRGTKTLLVDMTVSLSMHPVETLPCCGSAERNTEAVQPPPAP